MRASFEQNKTATTWILSGISFLLLAYSTLKAVYIPLTVDEIYSLNEYVKKGFITYTSYHYMDANNHLLNTWLMEIAYNFFGENDFIFRLPNLLAHAMFLYFSAKLVYRFYSPILIISSFLVMNLNPLLVDYFSLARGYGLSMGLMMASLYFAYRYIEDNKDNISVFISMLLLALALLANFNLINYFLISGIMFSLLIWLRNKEKYSIPVARKNLFIVISFAISPALILVAIIPVIIHLKNAGAFFYGADNGFYTDTLTSLIRKTLNENKILVRHLMVYKVFIFSVLISSTLIIIFKNKKDTHFYKTSFLVYLLLALLLCFFANEVQHMIMHVKFPLGRTVIYYCLLFSTLLIFLLKVYSEKQKKIAQMLALIIALLFSANFVSSLSLDTIIQYNMSTDTRDMMHYLIKNRKKVSPEKNILNMGVKQCFEPQINTYRFTYRLDWLNRIDKKNKFNLLNDYFFIDKDELNLIRNINYKILQEYPKSGTVLVSNEQKWKHTELFYERKDFETEHNHASITSEKTFSGTYSSKTGNNSNFSDGFTYVVNNELMQNKNAIVFFNGMFYLDNVQNADNMDMDTRIIISFERNNNSYMYQALDIKELIIEDGKWKKIHVSVFVPNDVIKGDVIKCYLLNKGGTSIFVDDAEFKIETYCK